MKPGETIEGKTAETILQRAKTITIGGKEYEVPRPTLATLILVSEAISKMPDFIPSDKGKIVSALQNGANAASIAEVLAILMIGGKAIMKGRRHPLMFWRRRRVSTRKMTETILCEMTPKEITTAVTDILVEMQLGDFFDITTFLNEINLTKRTKVEKPIPSGQR